MVEQNQANAEETKKVQIPTDATTAAVPEEEKVAVVAREGDEDAEGEEEEEKKEPVQPHKVID